MNDLRAEMVKKAHDAVGLVPYTAVGVMIGGLVQGSEEGLLAGLGLVALWLLGRLLLGVAALSGHERVVVPRREVR